MGLARKLIESKKITRATEIMRRASGAVIILIGVYFGYLGLNLILTPSADFYQVAPGPWSTFPGTSSPGVTARSMVL
jgi:hypothetical protein